MCVYVVRGGAVLSTFVKLVLFSNLSSESGGAPGLPACVWYAFMLVDDLLYGLLD